MSDLPRSNIPLDGIYASDNVVLHSDRAEVRSGTRLLDVDHVDLPIVSQSNSDTVDATKSGYVVTLGGSNQFSVSSSNVGDYFVWPDDGKHELIVSVETEGASGSFTVDVNDTHSRSANNIIGEVYVGTGKVRHEINADIWDRVNNVHVILLGAKLYYSSWDVSSWTEIMLIGSSSTAPTNAKSEIKQYGSDLIMWNSNGKYLIKTSQTYPVFMKINNSLQTKFISNVDETSSNKYCRRYAVTRAVMLGNYFQSEAEGNIVELETPPAIDSNGVDYSYVFTEKPVGDRSVVNSVIIGGSLSGLADEVADWAAVSNGQFGIEVNSGSVQNIIVNFNGSTNWNDVVGKLQDSIGLYYDNICSYVSGHIEIRLTNPDETITDYLSAGLGGTDISGNTYLRMHSAAVATITTELTKNRIQLGTFTHLVTDIYTHYRVYATADTGINGINNINGIGNNPELFVHILDVPIMEVFKVSITSAGVVTALEGTFKQVLGTDSSLIEGEHFYTTNASSGQVLDGYTAVVDSSTQLNIFDWSGGDIAEAGFVIGGGRAAKMDIVDGVISYTVASLSLVAGDRLFLSDGSILTIGNSGEDISGSTKSGVWGSSGASSRYKVGDTVDDETLKTKIKTGLLKNRFWDVLPSCTIGAVVDGFLISSAKGGSSIYETQLSNKSLIGYYDPEFHVDTVQDSIQSLRAYPGLLSAICSKSTVTWSTEAIGTNTNPNIGSSSSYLTQKNVVDENTGTMFPESIASIDEGMDILFTNNSEVRLFDGRSYGQNIAEGKIMKLMRRLQNIGSASYDSIRGYLLWGTNGSVTSIGGVNRLPRPDICWRFAIKEEQGVIGGVLFSGAAWVKPANGIGGHEIVDSENRSIQVVLDNVLGKYYWISTYNGPTGSSLSQVFIDKDDTTGSGTEISWSITYGADSGSLMKNDIRHEVSNVTIDPHDASFADTDDHDSEGFRDGLQLDLYAYKKSTQWSEEYSSTIDITKDGDISFDDTPTDKAIQIKLAGNRSECIVSELVNYYTTLDQAAPPSKRTATEDGYQTLLATPTLWLSRNANLYKNLASGTSISGTATGVVGVDGKTNSGFQISAALSTISVTLVSGTLLFWSDGVVAVTIGGDSISLTSVGTHNSWTLYYASSITKTGVLILTPSGTRKIEDLRVYNYDISSAIRTYIYNDMVRNNGDKTMGLW